MKKHPILLLTIFAAIAVILAACGGGSAQQIDEPAEEVEAVAQADVVGEVAEEEVAEVAADSGKPDLTILWFAWQPCEDFSLFCSTRGPPTFPVLSVRKHRPTPLSLGTAS